MSTIQELRCIARNGITIEVLFGKLTAFDFLNFDNYKPKNIESAFKAKASIKDFEDIKKNKKGKAKHVSSDSDIDEEDVGQLEALLARRFHRGKDKYKRKLPIIYFNCNEVGHIAARCIKKMTYKEGSKYKNRKEDDGKDYKGNKSCYIVDEQDSDENDDEVVYVAMKDKSDEDEQLHP